MYAALALETEDPYLHNFTFYSSKKDEAHSCLDIKTKTMTSSTKKRHRPDSDDDELDSRHKTILQDD